MERTVLRSPGTALLVVVAWVAFVVASDGLISLAANREVVPLNGAGPIVGPLSTLVAAAGLAATLLLGVQARGRSWTPLAAAVVTFAATVLTGAVGYAVVRGQVVDGLIFAQATATSPFTFAAAALAAVAGLVFVLVVRAAAAGADSPKWPWERRDER